MHPSVGDTSLYCPSPPPEVQITPVCCVLIAPSLLLFTVSYKTEEETTATATPTSSGETFWTIFGDDGERHGSGLVLTRLIPVWGSYVFWRAVKLFLFLLLIKFRWLNSTSAWNWNILFTLWDIQYIARGITKPRGAHVPDLIILSAALNQCHDSMNVFSRLIIKMHHVMSVFIHISQHCVYSSHLLSSRQVTISMFITPSSTLRTQ